MGSTEHRATLLVLVDSLAPGGHTASLASFLARLRSAVPAVDVQIVSLQAGPVPPAVEALGVPVVPFPTVDGGRGRRSWAAWRSGMVWAGLLVRARRILVPGEEQRFAVMGSLQRYALSRSKLLPPVRRQVDVAIAWTELTALYALPRVTEARHTAAWIHPDYRQAGFRAEIDGSVFAEIDRIVAVSKSGRDTLEAVFPDLRGKFWAIRNPVAQERAREGASAPLGSDASWFEGQRTVVTVCRLHDQSKALVRAVRITAELRRRGVSFRWVVVGEGPDRGRIESAIAEHGVADSFVLVGHRDNPLPLVAAADGFVLQSYYEGMPVAVDEAIALGTPVLVTDYAAAREQVHSPALGRVVANAEGALIDALEEWISELGATGRRSQDQVPAVDDDFDEFLRWLRAPKEVDA